MSSRLDDVPVLATLAVAAKWLACSKRKVWQMGKDGLIRIERIGRSVRYYVREFFERRLNDHGQPG
jgi:hypothetical protein